MLAANRGSQNCPFSDLVTFSDLVKREKEIGAFAQFTCRKFAWCRRRDSVPTHENQLLTFLAIAAVLHERTHLQSTRIFASADMASGAALRARAISAFRSAMRYWSRGAMLGYDVLDACPCPCFIPITPSVRTKLREATTVNLARFISSSCDRITAVS
jgi:hypothetical protein